VSGKGMPAALLMANLQAGFRSQSSRALEDARGLLDSVNRLFYASSPPEHFATVFFGVYDDRTRRLRYINCGHPPPMLIDGRGNARRLEPTAGVIGLFAEWECDQDEVSIASGETLLAFSDGVTEAGVEAGLEYGETRLLAALHSGRGESVARALERVIESVHAFSPGEQSDDITLIGVRGC
jgi:sigma-B regulation protein RsbU (phosphoserine phosphatase)